MKEIKQEFAKEVTKNESHLNLAYAALLISKYLTQDTDVAPYLALLNEMAASAQPLVRAVDTDLEIVSQLNHYLFDELKFTGNASNYYHPNNSFLNKVLDSKTGIPISLSVIYLEVGQRLNLPVWGIGMPGHFIVGYGSPTAPIYIDVFNQGRILSEDDCLNICQVPLTNRRSFRQQYLKPVTKRQILFRMLLNLKQIYVGWEDWQTAYRTVNLMLTVRPDEINELRDRGLLAYRLNRLQDAIFDIKRYLFLSPQSVDAAWLEKRVEAMEEKLIRLN